MVELSPLKDIRGSSKRMLGRIARRVLPRRLIKLTHVEPGMSLTINLRRHVMFWSQGLARFEPSAVQTIRAATEPGDHALDIGANIGFFTTLLARWVGPEGRVLAAEPEEENREFLIRNLETNGCRNVKVCACAVSSQPGIAQFSIDEATGATGRLGNQLTASESAVGTGKLRVVETPVESIDSLCASHQIQPALIKIDIEGDEINAMLGATQTLRAARPIVVAEVSGLGGPEVIELLTRENYLIWDLEAREAVGPEQHPFMIIAIPGEKCESDRARRIKQSLRLEASSRSNPSR